MLGLTVVSMTSAKSNAPLLILAHLIHFNGEEENEFWEEMKVLQSTDTPEGSWAKRRGENVTFT